MKLNINDDSYDVIITYKNIKNMYLRVKSDLKIYITCSKYTKEKDIVRFIESNTLKINEIIKYMDICTFGLILGQIIGRWGNFFNSEAHGGETTRLFLEKIHIPSFIINGMYINGIYYHPTFFYESILNLIGLIILLLVRKNKNLKNGMILAIYLIWYSIVRFFIEALRTDSLMLGTLKMAQVISIILFITGIIIFIISLKKGNYYNERKN